MSKSKKISDQAQLTKLQRKLDEQQLTLQEKNRELQVETALERVRARTMAMQHSDELPEISNVLFLEIQKLGIPAWSAGYCEFANDKKSCTCSMSSEGVLQPPFQLPFSEHRTMRPWLKAIEREDAFYTQELAGKDIKDHYKYLLKLPGVIESIDEIADAGFPLPTYQINHLCFFSHGFLLFITYEKVSDAHDIFQRFAKVFEQTYTRFLDLQKAEHQAREAQIEVALETVRSRSLAMHQSDELNDVVAVLFKKLKELQIPATAVGIAISIEGSKDLNGFVCGENKDGLVITNYRLPYFNNKIAKDICRSIDEQLDYYVGNYSKEEKNAFYEYLLAHTAEFKHLPEDIKQMIFGSPSYTITMVAVKDAVFNINDFEGKVLAENEVDIIKRFANVFEQAYTRFLDLKKAEAQARQAEIELALERVRARAMAMQSSDELVEASDVMFSELSKLKIETLRIGICTIDQKTGAAEIWSRSEDTENRILGVVPQGVHPVFDNMVKAWKNNQPYYSSVRSAKEVPAYYRALAPFLSYPLPKKFNQSECISAFFFSQGSLNVVSLEPLAEESSSILIRFAKVFGGIYQRFLDLKNAEAQAREAQIEAALERVRSRTMAMHNSEELKDVVKEIFDQMSLLNIHAEHAGIVVDYEPKKDWHFWVAEHQDIPSKISVPYLDLIWDNQFTQAKKKGKDFFTTQLNFEEKNSFYEKLLPYIQGLTKKARDFYLKSPGLAISTTIQQDIGLYIENFDGNPYSSEENEILMRFGKVFQQAYTRFLDLKTAEAQAREAQIEVSLERVRARSIGMQKSEELQEVILLIYDQMRQLGIMTDSVQVEIYKEGSDDINVWVANEFITYGSEMAIKDLGFQIVKRYVDARKKGEKEHYFSIDKKTKDRYYAKAFKETDFKYLPEGKKGIIKKGDYLTVYGVFMRKTGLQFVVFDRTEFESEEKKILKRFAEVFDQFYTRFLDLQKAEARAREAQIEVALEKVRSRSLAMHKSDELQDVVNMVFEQLKELEIEVNSTSIYIFREGSKDWEQWVASYDTTYSTYFNIPYYNHPIFNDQEKAKKSGVDHYAVRYNKEQKNAWFDYAFKQTEYKRIPSNRKKYMRTTDCLILSVGMAKNTGLQLAKYSGDAFTEEDNAIVKRFSSVFEQAYIRFLDLQKAESQAREAEIELAIERVRNKAIAMRSSHEVSELMVTIFQELQGLDMILTRCFLWVFNPEDQSATAWMTNSEHPDLADSHHIPYHNHPSYKSLLKAWKTQKPNWEYLLKGKTKTSWDKILVYGYLKALPAKVKKAMSELEQVHLTGSFNTFGGIQTASVESLSIENREILHRFSQVFEQTYTRFLDLQKAEAQAREARIEAALERIRSASLAMHESSELLTVIQVISMQLEDLEIPFNHVSFGQNDQLEDYRFWTSVRGLDTPVMVDIPRINHPMYNRLRKIRKEKMSFYADTLTPKEHNRWIEHMFKHQSMPWVSKKQKAWLRDSPFARSLVILQNIFLVVSNKHGEPFNEDENQIIKRVAAVFEQTYTRFLDLKKAEAQAREAQIEAALERVRSASMAMHDSNDLSTVIGILFSQLDELNLHTIRCGIGIFNDRTGRVNAWTASEGEEDEPIKMSGDEKLEGHPLLEGIFDAWKNQQDYSYVLKGEDLNEYYNFTEKFNFPIARPKGNMDEITQYYYSTMFPAGQLFALKESPFTEAEKVLMRRFADVFHLTFIRHMDLMQAEAQAREAQIEAALERVRAASMAMHKTEELEATSAVLFEQLDELGIHPWRCGTVILNKEEDRLALWSATKTPKGKIVGVVGETKIKDHKIIRDVYAAIKRKDPLYIYDLTGKRLVDYLQYINRNFQITDEKTPKVKPPKRLVYYCLLFDRGGLYGAFPDTISDADVNTLQRFSKAFEQTYTRFLDLQKAEAQTREAQIEAALERVRARTMAMQESGELSETATVLFQQLHELGVVHERINIGIVDEANRKIDFWVTTQGGDQVDIQFSASIDEPTTMSKVYSAWKSNKKTATVDLKGAPLKKWLDYLKTDLGIPFDPKFLHDRRVQTAGFFSQGMLIVTNPEPLSDENLMTLERFADVFNLTYARFSDLKTAEAQTHKANIEVALERVRGRAMAMQEPEELVEVAEVMRQEMGLLGVEELETSSIYINKEGSSDAECWYALKDIRNPKKKLVSDHFELDYKKTWVGKQMLKLYQSSDEEEISIPMKGEKRKEWINYCSQQSIVIVGYYGKVVPERTYHLCKFSNGAIGAATPGPISDESWDLLRRACSVFSLAYARFKDLTQARIDLKLLKEEKQRAEQALSELKATQTQLIQSEKMASLGELTAGIAHEIQNPLNFVNNFSELSNELITEIQEERSKTQDERDDALESEILKDIEQNLEKINHHGKRASGIVKGMLEHSRSGDGVKEPTNINALADEYLRLAYHGLRAKDSSFNADFETKFDENLPNVYVIPQDMGRVLLNLINNAFFAVTAEAKAKADSKYQPKVVVTTKNLTSNIQIQVSDNGSGIPEHIKDKIFQPFFTTKPTGEGTGLGLSLSYDIITKGHGGELTATSKKEEGTIFTITLRKDIN